MSQILVINRVRVLGGGPHTPTQFFWEYPPGTGPMNWNSKIRLYENAWKKIFTLLKSICKETKLKEFQFKLIHRIVVNEKSFIDMVLKRTMNVSNVARKIQLIILFLTADL